MRLEGAAKPSLALTARLALYPVPCFCLLPNPPSYHFPLLLLFIPQSALQPGEPTGQATLLILDRINDLAPILMHDTTYEGLTIDLLDHTPGLVRPPPLHGAADVLMLCLCALAALLSTCQPFLPPNSGPTAKTMLDDRDSVWQQHRTLNWNHVVESLSNAARKLNAQEMELEAVRRVAVPAAAVSWPSPLGHSLHVLLDSKRRRKETAKAATSGNHLPQENSTGRGPRSGWRRRPLHLNTTSSTPLPLSSLYPDIFAAHHHDEGNHSGVQGTAAH